MRYNDYINKSCINHKGGENVEELENRNNGEIIQRGLEDFEKVQRYMAIAKEENAARTYNELKIQYISLKALLSSLGVNMAEIDRIKE